MAEPLVSIIIPVYNADKHLDETIRSAIAQTWPNKEIIIVDDGSTDNSLAIAQKFDGLIIAKQKNKGASAARNNGLSLAKGEYIQFLDADDLLAPDKITSQIGALNKSTCHIALCHTVHFADGSDYQKQKVNPEWYSHDFDDAADFLIKLYASWEIIYGFGGMIQPNAWLTPIDVIRKAGAWNEQLSVDDDGEFFCRAILASEGIRFSDTVNYYRKHSDYKSLSALKSPKGLESSLLAVDLKYDHLSRQGKDQELIDKIFAMMYNDLAVRAFPQCKDISGRASKKARKLMPQHRYNPYQRGFIRILSNLIGWKTVRLLQSIKHSN
jgi:glycosyltransferase involved in cell wall biosynthesis